MVKEIAVRSATNITLHDYVYSIFGTALPICMEGLRPRWLRFQEPDYIAGIVKNIPAMLGNNLLGKKAPQGLSISGCYVHKSPLVTFLHDTKETRCEAGDLLVLYHERSEGSEKFNAVLFQFKRSSVDRIDEPQFTLYSEWPEFNFGRKIDASRTKYNITPKAITAGAQYSYIHIGEDLYFTVAEPHRYVIDGGVDVRNGNRLEEYMADFVTWSKGRELWPRDKIDESPDPQWSRFIWDIFDKTFDVFFSRANIGENRPRGFGERMALLRSDALADARIADRTKAYGIDAGGDECDGACSLLVIDNCMPLKSCFIV